MGKLIPNPAPPLFSLPFITVSAKGVANGLSTEYNDGADFGPDTMLGATSKDQYGPPYTQTSGIQEALDYSQFNGNSGVLLNGGFYISVPIVLRSTYVNAVMQGINGNGSSSGNGTQIYLASDFDTTTYNYMILLQLPGNLIYDNIRLTPSLPNGTKINYTINFAVNSTSNMQFSNATWDAAAIAQLYVSQNGNNGRYTFEDILFNGGGQYTIYSTYPISAWNFYSCSLNSPIYTVIPNNANGSFQANFIACDGPYIHSLNTDINLQNALLKFVEDGPILYGTAQIGDNVTINVVNGRISQYTDANWFNIQGTNFNMNIEDSYMNMSGGTSGSTYYLVTAASTASGMVRINRTYESLIAVSGVSMQVLEGLGGSPPPVPVIITNTNPNATGWITDTYYTVAGTTAGTVSFYIAEYTPNYKKIIAIFDGYENDTTTAQNIIYPWAPFFRGLQNNSQYPALVLNSTGLTIGNGPSPASIFINAPDSTTTYSGIVIVEGY